MVIPAVGTLTGMTTTTTPRPAVEATCPRRAYSRRTSGSWRTCATSVGRRAAGGGRPAGPVRPHDTNYLRQYMARRKLEDDPARPRQLITESGLGYRQ